MHIRGGTRGAGDQGEQPRQGDGSRHPPLLHRRHPLRRQAGRQDHDALRAQGAPALQPLAGKPPAGKDSAVWWSSHPLHPPHVAPLFAVGWQCPGSAQRVRRRPRCKQSCSLRPGYRWSGARGLGAGARGLEGRREKQSSTCKLPQEQSIPLQPRQPPRSTVGQLAGGPVPRCACMDFLSPRGPEDTGIKVSERCRGCAGDVLGRGEGRG